ncbi:LacI family DNA-binding transcriptional regulator [Larsenimonas rhizosphaerae]|uniref:LacI family DNA-binding transcriptional regulator n=1 Tax=Larsenimonas rhizosphaerae TaxID=2944682 RepID=UPI002034760C|nr:LacI family DNA-binding transcriptional regulator [Larsenimonas rhizosphaerae]MCM2131165.1 LacI family DNA-binding transcriptional regulator [Larsenimonas rhizosphaerae]
MKKQRNATAPRRATLKSVAAYLNISTATVSNAFNRPDQLSSQLREEVLAASRALGYQGPDSLGRSLRTGQSRIIGIMLADNLSHSLTDSVASEFLSGISEVLDLHGYRMLLLTQSASQEIRNEFNGISDGYLVYGSLPTTTSAALARGDFSPAVTIDMRQDDIPSVQIDDQAASNMIGEFALASGARRPAILALCMSLEMSSGRYDRDQVAMEPNTMAYQRLAGFDEALLAAGHDPQQVPVWNVKSNTFTEAVSVVEALLSEDAPDLVLCMSDQLALTVLAIAEQRGIDVPGALAVTGFDGIPEGQQRRPILTTVYQNSRAKGRLAALMVIDQSDQEQVILPTWLIVGDTCPAVAG